MAISMWPRLEPRISRQVVDRDLVEDQERQDRNIVEVGKKEIEFKWLLIKIANVPSYCVWLNGQAISRVDHPGLFSEWGTLFGDGDGRTTFNVPDLRGKMLIGAQLTDVIGSSSKIAASGSAVVDAVAVVPVVYRQ